MEVPQKMENHNILQSKEIGKLSVGFLHSHEYKSQDMKSTEVSIMEEKNVV